MTENEGNLAFQYLQHRYKWMHGVLWCLNWFSLGYFLHTADWSRHLQFRFIREMPRLWMELNKPVKLTSNAQCKLYCTSHAENSNPYDRRIYLCPCQWWCRLYSPACRYRFDGPGHNDGHLPSLDLGDWSCQSIAEWLHEDSHLQARLLVHAIPLVLVYVRSFWLVYDGMVNQVEKWKGVSTLETYVCLHCKANCTKCSLVWKFLLLIWQNSEAVLDVSNSVNLSLNAWLHTLRPLWLVKQRLAKIWAYWLWHWHHISHQMADNFRSLF